MSHLRSIYLRILGDIDVKNSEKYYLTVTCFFGSFYILLICAVHIIMGLPVTPAYFAGGAAVIIFILYLLVRFRNMVFISKLILTFGSLVAIDLTWYFKYMSNGPVLFFLFLVGAMIQWVWNGRSLVMLFTIYVLNILLLFFVESKAPAYLTAYPDESLRSIDIYLSFLLYSGFMMFLLNIVKKDFIKQKESVIRADKLKSAFLANISHEIRTPMNAIIGFSNLMEMGTNPENTQKYLGIIQNNSNNLLQLINDIVDLSKIEVGDLTITENDFSIKELFDDLHKNFSLELIKREKKNIVLDYYIASGDFRIRTDHLRLKQVISNLINNAIKFTHSGRIVFSCERQNGIIKFAVADTGTGIPVEDQSRIFDRFTKFSYTGINGEGTGIGLSIVEKIISMLNGQIWLESVVGEGSVFHFTIPDKIPQKRKIKLKNHM